MCIRDRSYFEARKASAVFHGRLHVRAGIELGQPMQNIEAAEDILDACDFDFTLASVHNVQGMQMCIRDRAATSSSIFLRCSSP